MNDHGTKTKDQREEDQAGKRFLWSLWTDILSLLFLIWAMISICLVMDSKYVLKQKRNFSGHVRSFQGVRKGHFSEVGGWELILNLLIAFQLFLTSII